jgi:hypothetical protein
MAAECFETFVLQLRSCNQRVYLDLRESRNKKSLDMHCS